MDATTNARGLEFETGADPADRPYPLERIDELEPNGPGWDRANARRYRLIVKKVDGSLTDEEEIEFEALQTAFTDKVEKKWPRRVISQEERDLIKSVLGRS